MAVLAWRRGHCGDCGTHPDEFDPKKGGHRKAYIAEVYQDPGCKVAGTALEAAMERARKAKRSTSGLKVRLVSQEELELRHEREDRAYELEEINREQELYGGLSTGTGDSTSRSLRGS